MHERYNRQDPVCESLVDCIPSVLRDFDVDRRLHLVVCMESTLPKGLPRSGTSPEGIDHGYMVHDYQLPTRAIRQGLWPL